MTDVTAFLLTVAAVHWAGLVSPGPNILVVMRTAMGRSRQAGVAAAAGVACGGVIHATTAMAGTALILASSDYLYQGVRVLGGLFLIWIAIKYWRGADQPVSHAFEAPDGLGRSFGLGLATNLSNPKSILFFASILTAVLPPDIPNDVKAVTIIMIGSNAFIYYGSMAVLFSTQPALATYGRAKPWIDRIVSGFLGLLGLRFTTGGLAILVR